jgi:hypothetical protein
VSTVLLEPIFKSWGNIRRAVLGVDGHIAAMPAKRAEGHNREFARGSLDLAISPPAVPEIELELRVVVAVIFV